MEKEKLTLLKSYISQSIESDRSKRSDYNISDPRELWYSLTRPIFIKYAQDLKTLNKTDLLYLTAFAYSWMPTVPKVCYLGEVDKKLNNAVLFVNKVKLGDMDMDNLESYAQDFENLRELTNNSYVGMSKVLHFINPELFCIYDSRVLAKIKKITGIKKMTFFELTSSLYFIKKELWVSLSEIDLILWSAE
jgi:hypothetical protein